MDNEILDLSYIYDLLILLGHLPGESIFYDREEQLVHRYNDGVLEISTAFADYSTYYLSLVNNKPTVRKEQLDNYKLHDQAKVVTAEMDELDWIELKNIIARMVEDSNLKK